MLGFKKRLREYDDGSASQYQYPSFQAVSGSKLSQSVPSTGTTSSTYNKPCFKFPISSSPSFSAPYPLQTQLNSLPDAPLSNPSLVFVNVFVRGTRLRTMVDTGASRSFIAQHTLNRLHHSKLHSVNSTAQLGDGHTTIQILGEIRLVIQFARIYTSVCALVVKDLNSDFILGGDWCYKHRAQIDYATNQVSIRSFRSRVAVPYDKHLDHLTLPLKLINSIKIPPRESCVASAHLQISSANTVRFQPNPILQQSKFIVISPSLLNVRNYTTQLLIYNPTDQTRTLSIHSLLGHVTHTSPHNESFPALRQQRKGSSGSSQPPVLNSFSTHNAAPLPLPVIEKLVHHIRDHLAQHQIRLVLRKFCSIFDLSVITQAKTPIHHAIPTGDHLPISSRPYPKTVQQRRELQDEIHKMLQHHQIRPSTSPWSSPVIIHKKPDGGIRFLVDYRKLNSVTKKDSFPQPTTEELLQRLGGHRFFTKLDLKAGYFQLPIHDDDKEKTAFITQDGLWEFNVLPQGIMNGPPTFQRTMHNLLGTGRWDHVIVYLDDILIFSRTFDEHLHHLSEILSLLSQAQFQVNPDKCIIAVNEINFLSHTINEHGIKPTGEKIKAIIDLPAPTTLTAANAFLGKINWYRKFIPHFSEIAAPLYAVTNKTKPHKHEFFWGVEQQHSFDTFKRLLTTSPLFLEFPDPSLPFILTTDASGIGIGGILWQKTPHGTRINYFKSRVLTDTERNYDTFEKEALAIYWCISNLRSYLGDADFMVETDHKPLENFHRKQINNKRVMNWLFKLQDLLPQITAVSYRKGSTNTAADYISRNFPSSCLPIASSILLPSSTSHDCPLDRNPPLSYGPQLRRDSLDPHPISFSNPTTLHLPHTQLNVVTTRAKQRLLNGTHLSDQHLSTRPSTSGNSSAKSPSAPPSLDFSFTRLRSAQAQDLPVQNITSDLAIHPQQSFFLQDGILFKRLIRRAGPFEVPYVPNILVSELLSAYHDHPLSGHFGVERTWSRLRDRYYWPNMKRTIVDYVRSCPQCAQHNIPRHKPPGALIPITPPDDVFQVLGMDWWGPAPQSLDGNKYVLVLTDRLSGYVIAKASPSNTAHDTARILMEDLILIHGAPDKIITDQGPHFKNELLQAVTNLVGCQHVLSTPSHPQTNGQTERWNATFATRLAKYCNSDHNNWDTYLSSIVFAYNHGVHRSTGFSPYQLAFGRQARDPFAPPPSTFVFRRPHDYWMHVVNYKRFALQQAQHNIHLQQHGSKTRYDLNRPHPVYKVDDLVWIKVLHGRAKLDARYAGPGRITSVLTPVSFIVEDNFGRSLQLHSNSLKPVYPRQ